MSGNRRSARDRRGLAAAARWLAAAILGWVTPAASAAPPNVVLLVADDLGAADLGGRESAGRPDGAIGRLADAGVRFRDATAAASICSPSRVALLAGVHPARVNLTTFLPGRSDRGSHRMLSPAIEAHLPGDVPTLAERLIPAGYRCHHVGKWHLGGQGHLPVDRGFTTMATGPANPGPESAEGAKGEIRQADAAVRIIGEQVRDRPGEPFLLVVGFDSPHVPLAAAEEEVSAHGSAFNPVYAAMVAALDRAVGRIVAAIDDGGIGSSTLVIFTSDNGGLHVPEVGDPPPTSNAPWRAGKGFLFDGGLRVPLVVRLPGFAEGGRVIDLPVATGDIVPTICALAGVAPPEQGDFRDLSAVLAETPSAESPAERAFHWHQPHYTNQGGRPGGAIRRGRWKLIERFEDGGLELYDLAADPGEGRDVAAEQPAIVADLRGRLEAWRREVDARQPTANPRLDRTSWRACHADTDVSRLAPGPSAAVIAESLRGWRRAMDDDAPGPAASHQGLIHLPASAAHVVGATLRYETPPEKDTLGYWVDPDDHAWWEFPLAEPGRYSVTVLQGCGTGQGGSVVAIEAAGAGIEFTVEETGHFQRFVPRQIGELSLPAGVVRLAVRPVRKKAAAVMDLRRVTLERLD